MSDVHKPIAVSAPTIKIAIIEDHGIVRAGLRMLLDNQSGMEVVSETSTASDVLNSARRINPDVILLDLDLGQENGIDFVRPLLEKFAPAKVLVLTAVPDLRAHLMAATAGASGIVMKEQAPESLVQAIHSVHNGQAWLGRSLTAEAMAKICQSNAEQKEDPETAKIALLTAREREIVVLVTLGYNSARIAANLGISEATVRNHLTSILSKLELANKFELAVFAFRHRLNITPSATDSPPWQRRG